MTKQILFSTNIREEEVNMCLTKTYMSTFTDFYEFQRLWFYRSYKAFNDFDKYLILAYFFHKTFDTYNDYFIKKTYDEFYTLDSFEIEKFNIVNVSKDLIITKETARRKILELEKDGILQKDKKSIRLNQKGINTHKPEESIKSLKVRSSAWQTQKDQDVQKFNDAIAELEKVDITKELDAHKRLQKHNENYIKLLSLQKEKAYHEDSFTKAKNTVEKTESDLEYAQQAKCPTCEQPLHDEKHKHLTDKLTTTLTESKVDAEKVKSGLVKIQQGIDDIGDLGNTPDTYYDNIDEAYNHKGSLKDLKRQLSQTETKQDPYEEQIIELNKSAIQKIDYNKINEKEDLFRHQEFLYKLLTAKDSFIRTRIIEQNLTYLNQRLAFYLGQVKLPHTVVFQPDLTVRIEELGRELDFDNLSRGERNRLILSLSWAFRDVWESLYQQINLLFIDELVDAGMDISGVESSMAVLKDMSRTQQKNIFLISHKDELISRVNSVLKVVKENGFTNYANDVEIIV